MLVWVAESKSLRNSSVVASMSACQVCKVVLRSSPVMSEPEELHHERLGQGLVNRPDETHLLHSLEVEIVQLIHDLSHLLVNLPPS